MMKKTRGDFQSFRKSVRHVGALPQTAKARSAEVWRPGLNDTVQTPSGTGIVVEVSGDMYLIDLDKQVARIWERLSSIKRLS